MPVSGKKGKGKEDGHQGNRLYSYSTYVPYITYVLKSIHKGVVPFFGCRYALSCREGSHSRKPPVAISRSIHPYRGV